MALCDVRVLKTTFLCVNIYTHTKSTKYVHIHGYIWSSQQTHDYSSLRSCPWGLSHEAPHSVSVGIGPGSGLLGESSSFTQTLSCIGRWKWSLPSRFKKTKTKTRKTTMCKTPQKQKSCTNMRWMKPNAKNGLKKISWSPPRHLRRWHRICWLHEHGESWDTYSNSSIPDPKIHVIKVEAFLLPAVSRLMPAQTKCLYKVLEPLILSASYILGQCVRI